MLFVPALMVFSGSATGAAVTAQVATTACLLAASAGKYAYDSFNTPDLPTFQHEAEVGCNKGLSEARELTSETREKSALHDELMGDERARMGVELPRLASGVDTTESLNHTLSGVISTLPTQHASNHEPMQVMAEELSQQRPQIQDIKASLEEQLPRLIRTNQEKQALLIEINQLKATNRALEGTVSKLSSGLDDALACVEEGRSENNALRNKLRAYDEEKQNAQSSFGLHLFRS